jgi:ATP-dependent helicase HepA
MNWNPGDRLTHRLNRDLGTGIVVDVDGRFVVVQFPKGDETLRLAADSKALVPLLFRAGQAVRDLDSGKRVVVDEVLDTGQIRLRDGRELSPGDLWPDDGDNNLLVRLTNGDVDAQEAFALRLDTLRLGSLREADGMGSFLGGRIQLFPHQLHAAQRATRADPVRWLLADEVGLGKTVESCLILNHLLRTGRADRTLVVAPETLTVQWLGELWRKYHQVFVLLDKKRLQDVERDHGKGFNPFDVHRRVVVSQEQLESKPQLSQQAVEAGIDLLVVDEAHHLRRRPGHPGSRAYRAIAPIAAAGRHLLLLTAVPLEDDVHGFYRLLQLLHPAEFEDEADFEARLRDGRGLPACTSATRRADIGGLPPRVGMPIDLAEAEAWSAQEELVEWLRARPEKSAAAKKRKAQTIRRALASPSSLAARAADMKDAKLRELTAAAQAVDPRVEWLLEKAATWQHAKEKTLVFVAERSTLEALREALNRSTGLRVGMFHEDMSAKRRDIEVAQFRLSAGPSLLISTECGGEGRNFEFCTRMLLYDLPWNPIVVEQRIGRLDRIGRKTPVEIMYFRPPNGLGATVAQLYERLGIFERPLSSLETELRGVQEAIEAVAIGSAMTSGASATAGAELFEDILAQTEEAYDRVQQAAYAHLHREPYRPDMAAEILARVPPELEELTRDVVLAACRELGLFFEEHDGGRRHWIELDARARVESLPGLGSKASFLGTFFREKAVEDETIDYFASGHPLVEGLLAHLDEAALGRVALLDISEAAAGRRLGLLALYKQGAEFEAVAFDGKGRERPDWSERLTERPLKSRRVRADAWVSQKAWPNLIDSLGQDVEKRGEPVALAAFRAD